MQSHLTENTEEEEEETWLPWQREGNRDCTDWVASGEEGMEERGKNGTEEGGGRASCRRSTGTQGPSVLSFARRCDRHANLANTLPLPNQAPSPAMAPRATKLEPVQEVWGWVCIQTQHRPHCPGSSLGYHPLFHSGTFG